MELCVSNMIHISHKSFTNDLFEESKSYLAKKIFDALWTLLKKKIHTTESNMNFDRSLKLKIHFGVFVG